VVTLYPHRPPEVGVPSENPNLTERGLIITDFVDRVGDPVGIVAADGSTHLADKVLADALRAMLYRSRRPPPNPLRSPSAMASRAPSTRSQRRPRCRIPTTQPAPLADSAAPPHCRTILACRLRRDRHCATSAAPGPTSRSSTPPTVMRRSARPSATPIFPATSSTRRC
jgi:hypothetical protein